MAESPSYRTPQPPQPPRQRPQYKSKSGSSGCLIVFFIITGSILAGFLLLMMVGIFLGRSQFPQGIIGQSIAMVRIEGMIINGEDTVDEIREYARNPRVSGIILRIDSPGGTVGASQEIYSAVLNARKAKPVYASMGNTAASGGYYIASAANKIFANPGTVTGSIGVIFEMFNLEGLVDKVGIDVNVVKSGKYKDIGSPLRPLEPEEKLILQGLINDTYEQFVEAIIATRKDALTAAQQDALKSKDGFWPNILIDDPFRPPADAQSLLRRIADGRLYSGRQAARIGLVDVVGSEGDCILSLSKAVGLEDPNILEKQPSALEVFLGKTESMIQSAKPPVARLSYKMHVKE